jgi:hypothetical protein
LSILEVYRGLIIVTASLSASCLLGCPEKAFDPSET